MQPGCHVGRSPVPALPDQNSRWFMLLIPSCLNHVCSESKDVNTEFRGDQSCKQSEPGFWALSAGRPLCSASTYKCSFLTDLSSASAGALTVCLSASALNKSAFTHRWMNLSLGLQGFWWQRARNGALQCGQTSQ